MSGFKLPASRVLSGAFPAYQGREVILIDSVQVSEGEKVHLTFEGGSSEWRQGVWLGANGTLRINGIENGSFQIWRDSAPETVVIDCHTADGRLHVYNIWDRGRGRESQSRTSGMLIEEVSTGYRYRCNDIGSQPRFDKLIFRLERSGA